MLQSPWIHLEDVHLSRGNRPVLKGITASLSGRAIGLVGANGAGKSTLIGALLGVLKADRGRVEVLGLSLPSRAMEVRTKAGVMAEQAGIFPGGSGADAVVYAGMLSGLSRREALRKAHRAFDALDMGEERYRPTRGYSTGMRQRCKLAMSLVHDPEVLILDEPTVGLDPRGRTQLLRLIRDLRDEGRKILLSTHVMHDAEFVCDDILVLDAGTVGFSGPVEKLLGAGVGIMVAKGAGLGAHVASDLVAVGYTIREQAEGRLVFEPSGDPDLHHFWRLASAANAEVRFLGRELQSLEDAVVNVMEGGQ
jgi:ABC-2 type transport system ATP-binding protein